MVSSEEALERDEFASSSQTLQDATIKVMGADSKLMVLEKFIPTFEEKVGKMDQLNTEVEHLKVVGGPAALQGVRQCLLRHSSYNLFTRAE